jgi:hypothetical protein
LKFERRIHDGVIAAVMESLFPDEGKNRYQWQQNMAVGMLLQTDGIMKNVNHSIRIHAV